MLGINQPSTVEAQGSELVSSPTPSVVSSVSRRLLPSIKWILLGLLISTWVGFGYSVFGNPGQDLLANYFIASITALGKSTWYLLCAAGLVSMLLSHSIWKEKSIKKVLFVCIQIEMAFLLSLGILVLLAVLHVNRLSTTISNSSRIVRNTDTIIEKLRTSETPVTILNGEDHPELVSKALVSATLPPRGGAFFNEVLIPFAVEQLQFNKPEITDDVLLVDTQLIFYEINRETIERVSPALGRMYVSAYLEDRYVKPEPTLHVLGRQEYLSYRANGIDENVLEIKAEQAKLKEHLVQLAIQINQANTQLSAFQSANAASGGLYAGQVGELQSTVARLRAEHEETTAVVEGLALAIEIVESSKDTSLFELGVFEPDKGITIALDYIGSNTLADYVSTLVHEYLHYTSYVSDEQRLPLFFEEGLTEYFARKAVVQELQVSPEIGYPLLVKIMSEIVRDVGEEEMQEIYLNKSNLLLVSALNKAYGDTFYRDSELYLQWFPFLPARQQLIVGNNLMTRIGGPQLTEEDMVSKFTKDDF